MMKYLTKTTYRRRKGLSALKFKGTVEAQLMVACQLGPEAEAEAEEDESCCSLLSLCDLRPQFRR